MAVAPRERTCLFLLRKKREIPVINLNEIEEGKFWKMEEIKKNLGNDIFTPNFIFEFRMLFIAPGQKGKEAI